ncbi:hypothetical protein [Pedobacter flavus]|uniref:Periplasmic heavy metal sensor n=1 Tax=Pedobacter flavus TaxID=3113906 RepID=A0ABU7H415_9SPHI|nr:hypothetical protein [Pedobacter sp. VNH31]MEE1885963.1 hypothetical protein [Pedobacter sp. VNH31]
MKKLLFICALLLGTISMANAQGGGRQMATPEERAKRSTDMLVERLKLNDDQKASVTKIYLEQSKAQSTLMQEAAGDREAMRSKMEKMTTEVNAKIEALLTDAQKKDFKAYLEERAKQMQNRQMGGGGGGK